MRIRVLVLVSALILLPPAVHAGDVTFTEEMDAHFEFSLLGGTVINPGPTTPFIPYVISPDLQFIGGELTNIVRDGSGNVISADVIDLSMRWTMVGTPYSLT